MRSSGVRTRVVSGLASVLQGATVLRGTTSTITTKIIIFYSTLYLPSFLSLRVTLLSNLISPAYVVAGKSTTPGFLSF